MAVEKALVVDDSKSARVMISRLLEQMHIRTAFVESAEDAFLYLQETLPDLIFMDQMMPGMDGLRATKLITRNRKTAHIPVVMYTSSDSSEYLEQARIHGALDVIVKPVKPKVLSDILKKVDAYIKNKPPTREEKTVLSQKSDATARKEMVEPEAIIDVQINEALEARVAEIVSFRIHSVINQLKEDWLSLVDEQCLLPYRKQLHELKSGYEEFRRQNTEHSKRQVVLERFQARFNQLEERVIEMEYDFGRIRESGQTRESQPDLEGLRYHLFEEIDKRIIPMQAEIEKNIEKVDAKVQFQNERIGVELVKLRQELKTLVDEKIVQINTALEQARPSEIVRDWRIPKIVGTLILVFVCLLMTYFLLVTENP